MKPYLRAYEKTPQRLAYKAAYNQRPEVKAKVMRYMKVYCQRPKEKARRQTYYQSHKVKMDSYHKAYILKQLGVV